MRLTVPIVLCLVFFSASGLASVGVGLIFNRNVAIIPEVLVPFSAGNGDAIFSIQFLFNFGQ